MENIFEESNNITKDILLRKIQDIYKNDYICSINNQIILYNEEEILILIEKIKFKNIIYDNENIIYIYSLEDNEYMFFKDEIKDIYLSVLYKINLKKDHCLNFISRIRTSDIGDDWDIERNELSGSNIKYFPFEKEFGIVSIV